MLGIKDNKNGFYFGMNVWNMNHLAMIQLSRTIFWQRVFQEIPFMEVINAMMTQLCSS